MSPSRGIDGAPRAELLCLFDLGSPLAMMEARPRSSQPALLLLGPFPSSLLFRPLTDIPPPSAHSTKSRTQRTARPS